jgi:hypothetical protein
VARVIKEIREEIPAMKKQQRLRVLQHLISYAEHQFGDRVQDKSYRERVNGERFDNWRVEIEILILIYFGLESVYIDDISLSMVAKNNLMFPYYEKMLELLRCSSC